MLIDELTPLQEQQLRAKMDHWLGRARCIAPLDRQAAKRAIRAVYAASGEPPPQIVFCASPMACLVAWGLLRASGEQDAVVLRPLKATICSHIPKVLQLRAARQLPRELSAVLLQRLRVQIVGGFNQQLHGGLLSPAMRFMQDSLTRPGAVEPLLAQVWQELHPWLLSAGLERLRERLSQQAVVEMALQVPQMLTGPFECFPEVLQDCCECLGATPAVAHTALLKIWLEQGRQCHWWLPCAGLVLASERPCRLSVGRQGVLHDAAAAALEYRDGYGIYAWRGVHVPREVITEPVTLTRIESEADALVRRVMIERYGYRSYIVDCNAPVVDSVPQEHPIAGLRGARLLRKDLPGDPEPIVYLEMVNTTPDANGTCRRYLERIDPHAYHGDAARLCHAAMASRWFYRDSYGQLRRTFERWQDYQPVAES